MKRKNEIIGKEQDIDTMNKTTDGKWVDTKSYRDAIQYHRNGALSLEEVKIALSKWSELSKLKRKVLSLTKKKAYYEGKGYMKAIDELKVLENQISIKKLKKVANSITVDEHIEVLKEVLKHLTDANPDDKQDYINNYDNQKLIYRYNKDRYYLEDI